MFWCIFGVDDSDDFEDALDFRSDSSESVSADSSDSDDKHLLRTRKVERACTDPLWLVLLVVMVAMNSCLAFFSLRIVEDRISVEVHHYVRGPVKPEVCANTLALWDSQINSTMEDEYFQNLTRLYTHNYAHGRRFRHSLQSECENICNGREDCYEFDFPDVEETSPHYFCAICGNSSTAVNKQFKHIGFDYKQEHVAYVRDGLKRQEVQTDRPSICRYKFYCNFQGALQAHGVNVIPILGDQPYLTSFDGPYVCLSHCPKSSDTSHVCWDVNRTKKPEQSPDYASFTVLPWLLETCRPSHPSSMHLTSCKNLGSEDQWFCGQVSLWAIPKQNPVIWSRLMPFLTACLGPMTALVFIKLVKDSAVACMHRIVGLLNTLPWLGLAIVMIMMTRSGITLSKALPFYLPFIGLGFASIYATVHFYGMHLKRAAKIVQMAGGCILDVPTLIIGPFVVTVVRLAWTYGILVSFRFTCAWFEGDWLRLVPSILIHVVTFVWFQLFLTACWKFTISYLTICWLRFGRSCRDECRIWMVLCRYHLGTMAYSAFAVEMLWPLRLLLGAITSPARMRLQCLQPIINSACAPCSQLYADSLEKLSALAYVEVVLGSSAFDQAAENSAEAIARERDTAQSLNGLTHFLQLVCVALAGWLGGIFAAILLMINVPENIKLMDARAAYTLSLAQWSFAGFVAAVVTASPVVSALKTVSDTILYCYVMQNTKRQGRSWMQTIHAGALQVLGFAPED